ncbi:MAG TPA: hypothetical protein VFZ09_26325 [Archangium sp.]|uniref:hypothetical protein n=1 Tax=Archangium sp. TaxID=1872627 RepID=UPI002E325030|nr:hypothetical protein [Archangium sp.]HEX5749775.1 hypothetical protein [Archangium sp.]
MASFSLETVSVLRFPLPFVEYSGKPRWLLWPVWAWRVVAPQARERKLNLFQRAVLNLCRAGKTRAEDIGAALHIGTELAARVLLELDGNGWLDHRGHLTPQGVHALEDEESEPLGEQVVGWTFTDPFTGEVWPRFHTGELPHADVESNAAGYPVLLSGSVGNPHRDDAYAVLPRGNEALHIHRPRAEDIIKAVRLHRKQYAWEENEPEASDAPHVRRVSLVSESPTPYLLAVRAWRDARGDWHMDDPFGIGDSPRLRRWVEGRFDVQSGLRPWIAAIAGGDPASEDFRALTEKATWDVEERLTLAIRTRDMLFDRLVAMQRTLLEAGLDGSPHDKWDDVAVKAQRAAERLFQELCLAHPRRTRLSNAIAMNELLIQQLAADTGFQTPLPPSLARVRAGKVEHADRSGSGSLRPLLVLALLGTPGVAKHPLARAANQVPDLLHRLDALAAIRDKAAHEGTERQRPTLTSREWPEQIRECVETVYLAVRHLLPN